MRDLARKLLRMRLTLSPGCALFRRADMLETLLPEVPGASGRYGPGKGVGEDLLLFLLTSLRYPRYAHVAQPLANFTVHPQSITMDAFNSSKLQALADAYAHARRYYLQQPGHEGSRSGLGLALDLLRWHAAGALSGLRVASRETVDQR